LRIRKRHCYYWGEYIGPDDEIRSIGRDEKDRAENVDATDKNAGTRSDEGGRGGNWLYHTRDTEWHYLYDGDRLVAIFDDDDNVGQLYINGSDHGAGLHQRKAPKCPIILCPDLRDRWWLRTDSFLKSFFPAEYI